MTTEPTSDQPPELPGKQAPEKSVGQPPSEQAKPAPKQDKLIKKKAPSPELLKEPITLAVLLQQLLRSPQNITYSIERGAKLPWAHLAGAIIASFALFGLILGCFSAGHQLWAAPLKVTAGILFSCILCLPSLIIFANLCNVRGNVKSMIAILACGLCLIALLLLGFIPVIWLFGSSSSSLSFFSFLVLITWGIGFGFGLHFMKRAMRQLGAKNTGPLTLWVILFTLVTLQMPTTLRPIIGPSEDHLIQLEEKRFFLIHWSESISEDSK